MRKIDLFAALVVSGAMTVSADRQGHCCRSFGFGCAPALVQDETASGCGHLRIGSGGDASPEHASEVWSWGAGGCDARRL